jgi:leucine dehydrogenase
MTTPWEMPDFDGHEAVHFFDDPATGLRAVIAVHSTHLGPSAGGCRFWHYTSADAAVTDALRLSRGMSYKNAMAGLPNGGGKGVILAAADRAKPDALLYAFGRAVESLHGQYITAEDVGMVDGDMETIAAATRHVSGLPTDHIAAGGSPGPSTAFGVFLGVKAAAKRALGTDDMQGVRVAIQGLGSVGGGLAHHLAKAGATLLIADIDQSRAVQLANTLGATALAPDAILSADADILAPCALGAILTDDSIATLRVKAIAGGANNQLAKGHEGALLRDRGIVYAPDYVINAGGIINVMVEHMHLGNAAEVIRRVEEIPGRLEAIWNESDRTGLSSDIVADKMAQTLIGRG